MDSLCVKFDPLFGTHIPNYDQLSSGAIARAIALGDTNVCVVCGRRTKFSISNKKFTKGCCSDHTREARRIALKSSWASKDDSLKAATNSKIRATMMDRYGVPTAGALPQHAEVIRSMFGGPSPFSSQAVRAKAKATCEVRYGGNPMRNNGVKEKAFSSRRRNNPNVPFNAAPISDTKAFNIANAIRHGATVQDVSRDMDVGIPAIYNCLHRLAPDMVSTQSPSLIEGQMYDAIHEHFPDLEIIRNTRSVIAPKEIDIYIPSLSLGVEMCGMYWHSEKFHDRKYHMDKFNAARDAGIHLMQVYDVEWENERRRSIFMSLLDVAAGNVKRVGARKLNLQKLSHKDANEFFDINHWQGGTRCSDAYGLVDGVGMIVQCMSVRSAVFYKQPAFEIARLCTVRGMIVPGGASKLLNAFIAERDPKRIISYTDNRLFVGSSMQRLGFKASADPQAGYMWYDPSTGRTVNRYAAFKNNLPKLLGTQFDPSLSQNANMHNCGWVRVFDAGQTQWVMHRA